VPSALVGIKLLGARSRRFGFGVRPNDSMVERLGLFVIVVLGEVVIGVVTGLSVAEQVPLTFATGLIALVVGFGFRNGLAERACGRAGGTARDGLAAVRCGGRRPARVDRDRVGPSRTPRG
jgi:Bacterial low temperature requirement A protein (LtrA)